MDAVILAAGRGERVSSLVPAFHKPLLPIDGIPLVCRAVDLAHGADVHTPVVVVAPSNAEAIAGALGNRCVSLIIQREPLGPGDALLTGLTVQPQPHVVSDRVLVLLSDNVMTKADIAAITAFDTAIGVKKIPRYDADRFTRFEGNEWREKVPIDKVSGPPFDCWVGPLVCWRASAVKKLREERQKIDGAGELLIGPYLRDMMTLGSHTLVTVSSFDVGTVDAYRRFISE